MSKHFELSTKKCTKKAIKKISSSWERIKFSVPWVFQNDLKSLIFYTQKICDFHSTTVSFLHCMINSSLKTFLEILKLWKKPNWRASLIEWKTKLCVLYVTRFSQVVKIACPVSIRHTLQLLLQLCAKFVIACSCVKYCHHQLGGN